MTNLVIFPLCHWPGFDPDAFGVELEEIVAGTRSLDARAIRLVERQRALKARLAATGLPEPLRRDALADWTRRTLAAEQRALRDRAAR